MFLQLWNQKDEIAKHLMTFRSFPCLSEASLRDGRRQPVSLWCSGAVSQFPSYALTALPYFWTNYNYTIKFLMNASPSDISQMVFMTSLFPKRSRFLFITREGWRSSRQHCRPSSKREGPACSSCCWSAALFALATAYWDLTLQKKEVGIPIMSRTLSSSFQQREVNT